MTSESGARPEVAEAPGDEASAISFHHFQADPNHRHQDQPHQDRRRDHRPAATLTVGLEAPPASDAIDRTSASAYFCSSPSTQRLTYGGMAGYKCFQHSNGTPARPHPLPAADDLHGHSARLRCS